MKNTFLGILIFGIFLSIANAGVYRTVNGIFEYNDKKVSAKTTTTIWEKDLISGETSFKGGNVSWKKNKDGSTYYATPTTSLERNKDNITYLTPGGKFEKKGDTIIYNTSTTSLTITKDKIIYKTPNTVREISDGEWKYTTPSESYQK